MDAVTALRPLGGAATYFALRSRGVSRHELLRARQCGEISRVRRGVYALDDAPTELVAALRIGGVLAGPSAAAHHGYPVLVPPPRPVIAVPRNSSRSRVGGADVLRLDLTVDERRAGATSPLRTVVECARRLPLREALVIVEAALRKDVLRRDLERAAADSRGPGARRLRRVVALADERDESPAESCARLVLVELAQRVEPQVTIPGVGRVDFLVDGWLVIEIDGFAFHADRSSYRRDRRRWSRLTALGYAVLVISFEVAVHRPDELRRLLRETLAATPLRPCPTCDLHGNTQRPTRTPGMWG